MLIIWSFELSGLSTPSPRNDWWRFTLKPQTRWSEIIRRS